MKHEIKIRTDGVSIEISEIGGQKEALLQRLRKCQNGTCSCPAREYGKIESLQVSSDDSGGVQVSITSKDGEKINMDAIENCLLRTGHQIS